MNEIPPNARFPQCLSLLAKMLRNNCYGACALFASGVDGWYDPHVTLRAREHCAVSLRSLIHRYTRYLFADWNYWVTVAMSDMG